MKVNVHDLRGEELAQVLTRATAALAQVPSPRVDAELLAAHLLYDGSRSRLQHAALMGERLTPAQVAEYEALVARRVCREPLQHITGSAPFYRLELAVGPGVFVPRPETELLVEEALKVLSTRADSAPRADSATGGLRIVDLCTGSGAIAAAVKSELPDAQVFAVELSEDAIPYTRRNLEPLGVHLVQGDALTSLSELAGTFDAVLSNPPYIPPANVPADLEAALHDPDMALYGGGEDGMQMPSAIAARAFELLTPGGLFIMEHDDTQEEAVAELLARVGFEDCYPVRDLNNRPRHSVGYKPRPLEPLD
ncbi:protein-(glutamine-N5) methyltransferase, release factor-specific [Rothia sp. HMSC062H08]|uniref:peptide chain release factor N(5)-glutamine methyltransferase n=1 Tax=Rothia sp. HMSC062H08 TaxID=1739269 RepID=UPI0008A2D8F0|nr:peptide chain release factor N(5)-glutamine methyltransferase [Rothia sp. HMSC062H08]OFL53143.1 protein-(glutamine-N5) methyltransferase, release factor-specific [Rothia sp. HMSC062H08]